MHPSPRLLRLALSLVLLALGLTALGGGTVLAVRHAAEPFPRPQVGEMVRFLPSSRSGAPPGPSVVVEASRLAGTGLAARDSGAACRFDSALIQRAPGSLMVVAVEPGGAMLHVRWAGGPTDLAADCGTAAELRMQRDAFVTLRNMADFGQPTLPAGMFH